MRGRLQTISYEIVHIMGLNPDIAMTPKEILMYLRRNYTENDVTTTKLYRYLQLMAEGSGIRSLIKRPQNSTQGWILSEEGLVALQTFKRPEWFNNFDDMKPGSKRLAVVPQKSSLYDTAEELTALMQQRWGLALPEDATAQIFSVLRNRL